MITITEIIEDVNIDITENISPVTIEIAEFGVQGQKGDTGIQGIQGLAGVKGDTGSQGLPGVKGDTGSQGIQGIQGLAGVKGDTGSQGLPGVKGDTGSQGIQGIQGLAGVKGDTGSQGIQGIQGASGTNTIINAFPNSTVTGTVAETLLSTFEIPSNAFPSSCMPNFKIRMSKTGDSSQSTVRLRFNITNNFATSTLLSSYLAITATDAYIMVRNPVINSGTIRLASATVSVQSDESVASADEVNVAFNTSAIIYLFISAQQSSLGDSTTLRAFKVTN